MEMPSGIYFTFSVLIGGTISREYNKDGRTYLDDRVFKSKLNKRRLRQHKTKSVSITGRYPFQVHVRTKQMSVESRYHLYFDGEKVADTVLEYGQYK